MYMFLNALGLEELYKSRQSSVYIFIKHNILLSQICIIWYVYMQSVLYLCVILESQHHTAYIVTVFSLISAPALISAPPPLPYQRQINR